MRVHYRKLFLIQSAVFPGKLQCSPSRNSPDQQSVSFPVIVIWTVARVPTGLLGDFVESDIWKVPAMAEDVHHPRMNVLLVAFLERGFPDFIFFKCVFTKLPHFVRIGERCLRELESGREWSRHDYLSI